MGSGEAAYHWSDQVRGVPSHCVGVCWDHGTLVSQAEVADPPTYSQYPYGQYFSEPRTSSPLQWRHAMERHKQRKKKRSRGEFPRTNNNGVTTAILLWLEYHKEYIPLYSLLARLPSRVAHKLSSAELCSSREFGFSTRILLMSSTLSWSSRANSVEQIRERSNKQGKHFFSYKSQEHSQCCAWLPHTYCKNPACKTAMAFGSETGNN